MDGDGDFNFFNFDFDEEMNVLEEVPFGKFMEKYCLYSAQRQLSL